MESERVRSRHFACKQVHVRTACLLGIHHTVCIKGALHRAGVAKCQEASNGCGLQVLGWRWDGGGGGRQGHAMAHEREDRS